MASCSGTLQADLPKCKAEEAFKVSITGWAEFFTQIRGRKALFIILTVNAVRYLFAEKFLAKLCADFDTLLKIAVPWWQVSAINLALRQVFELEVLVANSASFCWSDWSEGYSFPQSEIYSKVIIRSTKFKSWIGNKLRILQNIISLLDQGHVNHLPPKGKGPLTTGRMLIEGSY